MLEIRRICSLRLLLRLAWMAITGFALTGFPRQTAVAEEPTGDRNGASQKEFWGLTKLHSLHAEISAADWETMQKVIGGMRFPGAPAPAERDANEDGSIERHRTAGFGMEFPWARAELTFDGVTYRDVGVRFKGNGSFMMSRGNLKRNLKLEFDHFDPALRFLGMKSLNLNSESLDPTKIREVLAYEVFREAGVPAPKTALARVTLTVPGKYDKEPVGLYTLVEQIDRDFLEANFQTRKGLLLKPEWLRGVEYLGDEWEPYAARYQAQRKATEREEKRFMEFARLVNEGTDVQFATEIGTYLDIEAFLRFLGTTTLLSSFDSFLFSPGHNYFIYGNPTTGKFQFLPWDQDLTFAGFPMAGSADQLMDLSLFHPHQGENMLIDRLLALSVVRTRYRDIIIELVNGCFSAERLLKNIEAVEAVTKDLIAADVEAAKARNEGGGFGFGGGNMFGA
ncbi:MAG: hypothetical protein EHM42_03110, partial [Planctomycetaceae bacterium]